jgi:hypothetical protein
MDLSSQDQGSGRTRQGTHTDLTSLITSLSEELAGAPGMAVPDAPCVPLPVRAGGVAREWKELVLWLKEEVRRERDVTSGRRKTLRLPCWFLQGCEEFKDIHLVIPFGPPRGGLIFIIAFV